MPTIVIFRGEERAKSLIRLTLDFGMLSAYTEGMDGKNMNNAMLWQLAKWLAEGIEDDYHEFKQ